MDGRDDLVHARSAETDGDCPHPCGSTGTAAPQ